MPKHLVIVESPAKARTIERFLSSDYQVLASMGHIRDLPKSKLGVDPEADFAPDYEVSSDKKEIVKKLRAAAKKADFVILATDEDREGEAIAWHLVEAMGLNAKEVSRVVFHEVTETAIAEAMAHPRKLDLARVDAQQARRILDRLVGYKLSPFLWRKVIRGLSAGRVQSVAVRLIVEREREREAFNAQEYWTIEGEFKSTKEKANFTAHLHQIDGEKAQIDNGKTAGELVEAMEKAAYDISRVERKARKRRPAPPFITSTLQQEAARKLGYSAKKTMYFAQQLYEGVELEKGEATGLITYMRTDSTNLAKQAVESARAVIEQRFDKTYLPAKPNTYKTKAKGAQEAHEAIRPTDLTRTPESVKKHLTPELLRLYELIYKRTLACQMADAILDQTTVDITGNNPKASWKSVLFRATGSVIKFPGFLAIYEEGKDDEEEAKEGQLPDLSDNQKADLKKVESEQHFTQPPPRYTEATLVRALEENGIGRPSTYAPIISTIQDRGYVQLDNRRFFPEEVGKVVTDLLVEHFAEVVDIGFTAQMEESLDEVAEGKREWVPLIREFYTPFVKNIEEKEATITRESVVSMQELGVDPKSGKPVYVRIGRYGPFLQKGTKDDEEKPQFAPLPKGVNAAELTLERAMELFALPRVVGKTEEGEEITANIGRFGPYVKVGKGFFSIGDQDPYQIDEDAAREAVIAGRKKKAEKTIQTFPDSDIEVLNGRFGPYVTDGKRNAKIPKEQEPADLTFEQCEKLLADAPARKPRGKWKKKKSS